MAFQKSLWFLLAIFITFICSSHAYTFQVGGKNGWSLHPSENYNSWAGRLRFLINDTLHFKYDGGSDSVLVVNKGDYDGCNTNNPITKLEGGDSLFKLNRSGPFYFITGNKANCDQGQKLIVVVLALRNKNPPPSVTTPPSPSTLPPSPAVSPTLPPSPSTMSPVSDSPAIHSPVSSPSISPESSPSTSPESSPSTSPESSPPGTPILTPAGSTPGGGGGTQSPRGNTPAADANSPPSPSAATPPLSGTVMVPIIIMILTLWFD